MKNIFLKVISLCSIFLLLQSCSKAVKDNYTYTLKGNVVDRSTLQPAPQFELILRVPDGYMGSGAKEIGRVTSDDNGNFMFEKLPLKYNKNLKFFNGNVPQFDITPVPKRDDTADIGEVLITP